LLYRTIDSLGVAYGKGKLTCFLGDINGVIDAVSFCLALILQNGVFFFLNKIFSDSFGIIYIFYIWDTYLLGHRVAVLPFF